MIALPAGVQVYLAAGATDMRKYGLRPVMRNSPYTFARSFRRFSAFGVRRSADHSA